MNVTFIDENDKYSDGIFFAREIGIGRQRQLQTHVYIYYKPCHPIN